MTIGNYVKATMVRWTFGEEAVAIYIDQDRWMFDYFCGLFYMSSHMIMESSCFCFDSSRSKVDSSVVCILRIFSFNRIQRLPSCEWQVSSWQQ